MRPPGGQRQCDTARCRLAQPIRLYPGWPKRSLVVIAAPFVAADPAARQLAIRLLDKVAPIKYCLQGLAETAGEMARPEPVAQSGDTVARDSADAAGADSAVAGLVAIRSLGGDLDW